MQKDLEQIINTLLHTSELIEEDMKQVSYLKNLTARQLSCIEYIKDLKNPSLSELAACLNIAKASMSVMIDRLQRNKYIYKVVSDSDRRTAHVHLTEKGIKAAHLHEELHRRISVLLTKNMTKSEKEILIILLNKATDSLKKINNKTIS